MNRKNRGFTLIELLVTVALTIIVVGIGVPSLLRMIHTSSLISITNELVADLQFTRSEAIKRNVPVTICRSNAAYNACAAGTEWEGGWIVFVDNIGSSNAVVDNGEAIIRTHKGPPSDTMTIEITDASNFSNHLIFQGDGAPLSNTGMSPKGKYRLCDGLVGRGVKVNRSGRINALASELTDCTAS